MSITRFVVCLSSILFATAVCAQNYSANVASGGSAANANYNDPAPPFSVYNGMEAGTNGNPGFTLGWIYDPNTNFSATLVDSTILYYTSSANVVWKGQVFGSSNGGAAMWVPFGNIWNGLFSAPTERNTQFAPVAVLGACDFYQVGYAASRQQLLGSGGPGIVGVPTHAVLWSGLGQPGVDLHNSQVNSHAFSCDGFQQVGTADNNNGTSHAELWSGTAKSQIDLHTGPFSSSAAIAISGGMQGGWGSNIQNVPNFQGVLVPATVYHALIWHGSTSTMHDLNPAGFFESQITGMAQNRQIGWARLAPGFGPIHAMVWFGTAASAVDLHQFLPLGFSASKAIAIDPVTGIIYGAAYANGLVYATTWTPVP